MKLELATMIKMIMNLQYKYLLLVFLSCAITFGASATDGDTKVTKTINQRYLLPKNGIVDIENKYGQVVILNSENDSVTVKIEVVAFGKDRATANKIMDRVDFDFDMTNQYLTLETVLDRKSGAFKELWNNIGDYSKTLLSKNKLEINYEIAIPKSASINLNNKFGDVYIHERDKKVDITISHGNLRSNNFNATSNISVSYGDARIKHIKAGKMEFKSCNANILSLGDVEIQSSSSEITIKKAEELEIDSRSDKSIDIDEAGRVNGKMIFSKLRIETLIKDLDLGMSYSDISIDIVPFSFSFVRIDGKSSDIDIEFGTNSYMEIKVEGDDDDLELPAIGLDREVIDEKKGKVLYSGILGKRSNYKGNVDIKAQGGSVKISIDSQPQSVKTTQK